MTDDTITTTLFTLFPTACVTGFTMPSIMQETWPQQTHQSSQHVTFSSIWDTESMTIVILVTFLPAGKYGSTNQIEELLHTTPSHSNLHLPKSEVDKSIVSQKLFKLSYSSLLLTAYCKYEGLNLTPSKKMAAGARNKNDMIVMMEKRLMLSKLSCQFQTKRISHLSNLHLYIIARYTVVYQYVHRSCASTFC